MLYAIVDDSTGAESRDLVGYPSCGAWEQFAALCDVICEAEREGFKATLREQVELLKKGIYVRKILDSFEEKCAETSLSLFIKTLEDTPPGEPLIIPGGWSGNPGHALVYEIRESRSDPRKYQIEIHNTGCGAEYHGIRSVANMVCTSCFLIDEIEPSRLKNLDFLHLLHGFTQPALRESWTEDEVYSSIVTMLEGRIVSSKERPYCDIQRSGTCSFASYFAFLQAHMSERDCGRSRVALGIICIKNFLDQITISPPDLTADRNLALVEKSITNFSRLLFQAETEGWIDIDDAIVIQKHLSNFQGNTHKLRQDLSRVTCCLSPISAKLSENDPEDLVLVPSKHEYDDIGPKITYKPPGACETHSLIEPFPPINLETASDISSRY